MGPTCIASVKQVTRPRNDVAPLFSAPKSLASLLVQVDEHLVRNNLGIIYDKIGLNNRVELAFACCLRPAFLREHFLLFFRRHRVILWMLRRISDFSELWGLNSLLSAP